jgi:hypothetical protein
MTVLLDLPSRRFAHWDYASETHELVHRLSGCRIPLDTVLGSSNEMLRCIFEVHDKQWGNDKVLDELIELIGTYFKVAQVIERDHACVGEVTR